jgi:glycosyltransferase involved in cell wall biosynthesis
MKLIYVSYGNIPCRWAHSVQVMKMSQAFGKLAPRFELLTQGSLKTLFRRDKSYIFDFYGIKYPFRIRRLPIYLDLPEEASTGWFFERFVRASLMYARLHRNPLVYTRLIRVAQLAVFHGMPTILEFHGILPGDAVGSISEMLSSKSLLGVVTTSDLLAKDFADAGLPGDKCLVWPNAVDLERFQSCPSRYEARVRIGIEPKDFLAVYVGHLYEHKGVPYIIEAAQDLPDCRFLIVGGWSADYERYRSMVNGLRNVSLMPYVPNGEVPNYLSAADVLLLPNSAHHSEASVTCPLKLFEFMAAKRPIIASGLPGITNILKHLVNAYVIVPDCSTELVKALRYLKSDGEARERLAEKAWEDVQRYTWDRRARDILERFAPHLVSPAPGQG